MPAGPIWINKASNIAVITLWTKPEEILKQLSNDVRQKIAVIGNLYTTYGINYVLKTLGENPKINTIIVCGTDLSGSGESLINLFKFKKADFNLLFRIQDILPILNDVKVLDLRGRPVDLLIKAINENYNPERQPSRPVLKLEIVEARSTSFPFPLAGHYIFDTSVFRAWIKVLSLVNKYGFLKETEYGGFQKEYLNLMVTIKLDERFPYTLEEEFLEFFSKKDFELQVSSLLSGEKPSGVEYTYGQRIVNHPIAKNQLEWFINKLGKVSHTRRAVIVLWDHSKDLTSENPPCLMLIQGEISGKYYHQTAYFRSHDIFKAWPINVYGLIKFAENVVSKINERFNKKYKVGTVTVISSSAHIYQQDFHRVKQVLNKYKYKIHEFVEDPKGYFLIKANKGITVEQRYYDGSLIESKTFHDFNELYTYFKNDIDYSLFQHAFYMGKELMKAFFSMKNEKKYVQE